MNITPANELKVTQTRQDIVDAFCENLMQKINEAIKNGKHMICFDASVYLHKPSNKVFGILPKDWLTTKDWEVMPRGYYFSDYEDEVREKFRKAGYKIKPTGYIGGVWQLTEDISW